MKDVLRVKLLKCTAIDPATGAVTLKDDASDLEITVKGFRVALPDEAPMFVVGARYSTRLGKGQLWT